MPGMPRRRPELRRPESPAAPLTVPILPQQPAVRTPELRNVAPSLRRNWSRSVVDQAYEHEWLGAPRPVRSQAAARARAGESFAAPLAPSRQPEPEVFQAPAPVVSAPRVSAVDALPELPFEIEPEPPVRSTWERVRGAFASLFSGE